VLNLSVVIAAQDAGPQLRKCLAVLVPQLSLADMEAIVAAGPENAETRRVTAEFPSVRFLHLSAQDIVPRLWSAGIAAARGRIIALTIENCTPAPDWVRRIRDAHAAECQGIGGAIAIDPSATLVDWAVYFCRYSSYMPPFSPRLLDDIPGDNCSYKREALDRVQHLMGDGFWETFIHYDMRRRHEKLLSDPLPVVIYSGGLSAWRFLKRRYIHGRYFAARRGRDFTRGQRMLRAASFLAVPALLLNRIVGRVWRHGRHRAKLVIALPLIGCFLMAWAVGEGVGYFFGFALNGAPRKD
jgi:hypothetical protein